MKLPRPRETGYSARQRCKKGGKIRNGVTTRLLKTLISRDQVVRMVKSGKKGLWGDAEVETTHREGESVVKEKKLELSAQGKRVLGHRRGVAAHVHSHSSARWELQIRCSPATLSFDSSQSARWRSAAAWRHQRLTAGPRLLAFVCSASGWAHLWTFAQQAVSNRVTNKER